MGKGLREVAELPFRFWIVFLTQKTNVIAQSQETLEQLFGLVDAACQVQADDHPEAAGQEGAFVALEAVACLGRVVALHEAIGHEVLLDGINGAEDAWVIRRKKASKDHAEAGGVERVGAIALNKCVEVLVEAFLADLGVDLVAILFPAFHVAFSVELLVVLDSAVERDPGHGLALRCIQQA